MNQAICEAIAHEMESDENVILMGEDVAAAGGPFKTSDGLLSRFGERRVRDTPISEMGFLGAAVGAAACGLRPIVEIMFVEFAGVALDQIVTEAAKFRYLSGGSLSVPLVVRASVGAGLGFGCQHSQTLENWFVGTPGLKVVAPSDPQTAYSLLRAAVRDPDPVVVLEPRSKYGSRGEVDFDTQIEVGTAAVLQTGSDATVVALGSMVDVALEATRNADWSADVIDLRTVAPWDMPTVLSSVEKTGRLVLVEESPWTAGWGCEVATKVAGIAYSTLRGPVMRVTSPDVPVPYGRELESRYLPSPDYVIQQVDALIAGGVLPEPWWEGVA